MYKDPASRNPEKYFRLEFYGSSFLHKLANALVCMGDDVKLKISNEGMSISQMDTAEVALIEIALPKFSFKSFSFRGKEIVVPVKTTEFNHFTKNAKTLSARSQGSTILTGELLEPLSLNCYFIRRNGNVFKEVIGVMDLESVKEEPVIEVTYKNWFILSSSEFASCINALMKDDNDIIRFYLNKEKGLIVETGQSSTDNAPNENEESNDKIIRMIYPSRSSFKEIESKRDNVINKKTKQLQKGKLDVTKQSELAEVIESKKQAPNTTENEFRSFVTNTTHAFVKAKFAKIIVKNCNISDEVIICIEENSSGFKCVCFDFILRPGDVDIKKSASVIAEPELQLPLKETQKKNHEKVKKKITKKKREDSSDEDSENEDDEEDEEDRHRRRRKDKKRKRREKEKQKARKKQKRRHGDRDSDSEDENSEYDERSDIEDELESENEMSEGSSRNGVFNDGDNYAANYVREYGFIRFFLSHQIPEDEVPEQPAEGGTTKGGPEDSDDE